ncbi:sensor histidine kinase [Thiohalomonas denitrificans]|uniref:histidine kinase n=1 Tax=Thiohalomonas denitrificans TaxID=415747 RepID=A0A1G5PUF3_9GAMM|nr:ATP-binding protein [Thiohalomonas denitrificans]SCZ52669.1 PAS domain S-box-containing protein [Thiohalomonas denitrificans]
MPQTDKLKRKVETLGSELAECLRALEQATGLQSVLGDAIETFLDPVFLHDRDGRIVYANRPYLELAELASEQVLGHFYWEVLPAGSGPTAGCLKALVEPGVQEEEIRESDGRILRMRSFALYREAGEPGSVHSLHMLENITERKRHEESLQRANEELQRFTDIAAHDLKAPLRAVHGLSSWIEEEVSGKLSDAGREHMRLLRQRVQLMDDLIDAMLDYSRAGTEVAEVEEVESLELVREIIETHGVPETFTITVAPDLPRLKTDRLHLRQVFANLVGNAIEHHQRPDGHVWVSARDLGDRYEFSVIDDGPGIPPEYQERIFEMFQHGPNRKPGTGVGLAVVRRLVERFGGRITLESVSGRGSTFRFTWPKIIRAEHQP